MYIIGVKLVLSKQSRLPGRLLVNLWKRESYKPDLKAAKKFLLHGQEYEFHTRQKSVNYAKFIQGEYIRV